MAEQMQPMPDVPKRCWYCEREMTIENIRVECAYCGADVARAYEWLDALDAARAEAERWRKRYEALRAGVERILKQIEAAPKPEEFIPTNPDEMMAELLYAMRGGKGHNKGFANGLWVAGMMLRGLLTEAGGGSQ